MEAITHAWQRLEAKSHFSEVVDLTLNEGPQLVTLRSEEAVVQYLRGGLVIGSAGLGNRDSALNDVQHQSNLALGRSAFDVFFPQGAHDRAL